ncbi:MAG: hypothetical protein HIU83_17550 [Proteobacteria bacterium]|nr:hypothetical protein [Pseudomonadota bacterium]
MPYVAYKRNIKYYVVLGHKGAGIAIKTVMGDGDYPVFAEKYNDEIVRVYVNLV